MRRIILVALLLVVPVIATAQVSSVTWLRYFEAERGKEQALTQLLSQQPVLDRLLAEGKVTTWGVAVPMSHTDESWTHMLYVGARDWATIEALSAALASTDGAAGVVPNGIRDSALVHISRSQTRSSIKPKYLVQNLHPIKAGRENDAIGLFNEWAKPVFEDLATKGKITAWGHSAQNIVIHKGWTRMVWYFLSDLSALDAVNGALAALPPQQLRSYWLRLDDMSTDPYQGIILRIVHSAP